MASRTFDLVAYYYPGWHTTRWKSLDEWALLDEARPYFDGHLPLDTPLRGRYDDTSPTTLTEQITTASASGIGAFTFFVYYGPQGFELDLPTRAAIDLVSQHDGFEVGITWCMRLPHQYFPIPVEDDNAPLADAEPRAGVNVAVNQMLGDIVPDEMMDTDALTFVQLVTGKRAQAKRLIGGTVKVIEAPTIAAVIVAPSGTGPSLGEVAGFVERIAALGPATPWRSLTLLEVESHLALCGLLDLSVYTIRSLCELAAGLAHTGTERAADRIPVESLVKAFTEALSYVDGQDIRHMAALGARAATAAEVFSTVTLSSLADGLREPAQHAFSLRQVRVALEGIACDLAKGRR